MKTAGCATCRYRNCNAESETCKGCAAYGDKNSYEFDDNTGVPIAKRGGLCIVETLTFNCPYCDSEYQISDEITEFSDVKYALDTGARYLLHCDTCENVFIIDSYKEY